MAKTNHLGTYFVAFIDIVGQRDALKQLVSLPRNELETQTVRNILKKTSEHVKDFRQQFNDFYNAASNSTGKLDHLAPPMRELAEQRKKSIIWRRGFSDSYVITVPCWYETRPGVHILSTYSCLNALCAVSLWSLAKGIPIRGGAEIHLGTEIDEEEVYGPVTVRAYELESRDAEYPRIVIGEGLLNHLDEIQKNCSDNLDGRHTLVNIDNCRKMIATDVDSKSILDFMGEGVKSLPDIEVFLSQMIKHAYVFVVSEEKRFLQSGNTKLSVRYSRLRAYCESRLPLWGISPHKE